jgi:hypothetical protein
MRWSLAGFLRVLHKLVLLLHGLLSTQQEQVGRLGCFTVQPSCLSITAGPLQSLHVLVMLRHRLLHTQQRQVQWTVL